MSADKLQDIASGHTKATFLMLNWEVWDVKDQDPERTRCGIGRQWNRAQPRNSNWPTADLRFANRALRPRGGERALAGLGFVKPFQAYQNPSAHRSLAAYCNHARIVAPFPRPTRNRPRWAGASSAGLATRAC